MHKKFGIMSAFFTKLALELMADLYFTLLLYLITFCMRDDFISVYKHF